MCSQSMRVNIKLYNDSQKLLQLLRVQLYGAVTRWSSQERPMPKKEMHGPYRLHDRLYHKFLQADSDTDRRST
jgi:hypothetical protein